MKENLKDSSPKYSLRTKIALGFSSLALAVANTACGKSASTPIATAEGTSTPAGMTVQEAFNVVATGIGNLNARQISQETAIAEMRTAAAPTETPTLTATVTAKATAVPTATETEVAVSTPEAVKVGEWVVETFKGATDQMKGWVKDLKNLEPNLWPTFPNVPNPLVPDFRVVNGNEVPDGLEYGMDESVYCQQDQNCDIPVAARHYRIITGDYNIAGIDACKGTETDQGCGIMIVNVGNVTANFRDSKVDTGFTVTGRYRNGDAMPTAIWAGLSETANNMLNLDSKLNPDGSVNAGANCSVVEGCKNVRLVFAIVSGNELLVKGVTEVNR